MNFKKAIPYDIAIRPTPNGGFLVEVGCVKLAYSSAREMVLDLEEYLDDPEKVEIRYNMDIKALGRVHIRTIPDIIVRPYNENRTPPMWGNGSITREKASQEDGDTDENTES